MSGSGVVAPPSPPATDPRLVTRLQAASRLAGVATGLAGAAVLAGALLDLPPVAGARPDGVRMTPAAGLALLLAGIGLGARAGAERPGARRLAQGAALLVALLALLSLGHYVTGRDLGVERLFSGGAPDPGRMGLNTALAFLLLGLALLFLDVARRGARWLAQVLSLGGGAIALAALAGHLYDLTSLYRVASYTPMSLPAAVTLAVLAAGILVARPDRGLMATVTRSSPGGLILRRLLPATLGAPLLFGWVPLAAQWSGLPGSGLGLALLVPATTALFATLIWSCAARLDRADLPRQESDARRAAILAAALDSIITIDHQGRIVEFNPAAEGMFGFRREDVLGREMASVIIPPALRDAHRRGLSHYRATGEGPIIGRRLEMTAMRADGTEFPVELTVTRVPVSGPPLFSGHVRDITERTRTETRLRESEERFRNAFGEAPIGMALQSLDGRYLRVNRALCEMLGYTESELLAKGYRDITHPDDQEVDRRSDREMLAGDRRSYQVEKRYIHRLGHTLQVLVSVSIVYGRDGEPANFVAQTQDITERKRAEEARAQLQEELRQAQKMEAIGRLAGGVAHDFNNLLTVILGRAAMLTHHTALGSDLRRHVELIARTADRGAALTQQLLAFSRRQVLQPQALNLNVLVTGIEGMLRRLLGDDVELTTALAPDLGTVKADPGQVDQIVMNLAVNARDAMPDGGRLVVETANVDLDERYAGQHPGVRPGRYVMLAVSDTGSGMDERTRARVFEPFFTTKAPGRGTGLGLATVFGIVKQSGGNVWVYSEPGRGTTLKVYLPRVDEPSVAVGPPAPTAPAPGGSETILVVEDEDSLRDLTRESLEAAGYTVLDAKHGGQALVIGEQHPGAIHLLLTDVIMPHMNGRELADQLAATRPDLRVLYMSGYTGETIRVQDLARPGAAFLPKPFSPDALVRRVREVLDQARPRPG